jgi:CSLREA domain-containing protein
MSARAIKRSHDRSLLKDRRRSVRRAKRASIAAGAALGATVMFAPSAEAATFEVNTLNDTAPDGCTADPDGCTLREAVADANATGDDDTVTFASGLSGEIVLSSGQITVSANYGGGLEIVDDGTDEVSVSGNDNSRIFNVLSYLSITGLDLTDGYSSIAGGAIYVDTTRLALDGVTVTGSYAEGNGGGISLYGSDLGMIDSEVSGNLADSLGGGIHLEAKYGFGLTPSTVEMVDSEVSGNEAEFGGGILGEKYADIDIETSQVSGNVASSGGLGGGGGGVVSLAGSIDIDASEITGNSALDGPAGGISAKYADLTVTDSTVSGNDALGAAGVFIAGIGGYDEEAPGNGPDTLIRNSTISDNTAVYGAGGIGIAYIGNNADLLVSQSTISGNSAGEGEVSGVGGGVGIYGDTYGTIEFSNSTISGNTAGFGAGVSIDRAGEAYYGPGPARAAEPREVPAEGDG